MSPVMKLNISQSGLAHYTGIRYSWYKFLGILNGTKKIPWMSKLQTTTDPKRSYGMNEMHYTPVHPGEVLQDELQEIGLTQSALAKHIGVLPKTINEICRGKRGISAEMAMKLSRALGGSPQFWLNFQNNWEISQLDEAVFESIDHVAARQEYDIALSTDS
jgi:addiction module HigA family antidote